MRAVLLVLHGGVSRARIAVASCVPPAARDVATAHKCGHCFHGALLDDNAFCLFRRFRRSAVVVNSRSA